MPPENIIRGQRVEEDKVRRARELRRVMTPYERIVWDRLRGNRLFGFHFRRQQVIAGFIADFYCHAAGLVVEVDGPIHDRQREADTDRDAVFVARDIAVLRVTNGDVATNLPGVLDRIAKLCLRRATAGEVEKTPPPGPLPRGERGNKTGGGD